MGPRHEELLSNIPLFESLTEEDLRNLSNRVEDIEYAEGDVIFHQGAEGSWLFVIEEGAVEIAYGEGRTKVTLADLFPCQYFGVLSHIDGATRSATAAA